ncbi:MAG: Hydroxyacylglutathione hydrolase [Smithella sp. PtaU1.Bin162]|nr:MAG: Hydroxyacylglutathione hydrolase [Smithella sp. PtaU1.Bin162]
MLKVEQLRYGTDNFSYLLYGEKQAVAIDGGAWEKICTFLKGHNLELTILTNTHSHFDHTSGNENLLQSTKARFLTPADFTDNSTLEVGGEKILVYRTPGHSNDSVCFHNGSILVSGDTLFNGTIGNCFTGDIKSFYLSVKRLMALPDATVIYAGHDYVRDSLVFAGRLEPDNKDIGKFRSAYDFEHVFSTMADERRVNPYLRFNEEPIVKLLQKRGLPRETEWERWQSLMSIE